MSNIYSTKVVVITGSTAGIGYAMQKLLIKWGATVIAINRNQSLALRQHSDLKKQYPNGQLSNITADLSDIQQLPRVAQEIAAVTNHIDFLLHNAGGIYPDLLQSFNVNALSPFLLNNLLLSQLENAAAANIIISGSSARYMAKTFNADTIEYSPKQTPFNQYAYSKQCSYLLQSALQQQWQNTKHKPITINVLDVPMTKTNMQQSNSIPKLFKLLSVFFNHPEKTANYILKNHRVQPKLVPKNLREWQQKLLTFAEHKQKTLAGDL